MKKYQKQQRKAAKQQRRRIKQQRRRLPALSCLHQDKPAKEMTKNSQPLNPRQKKKTYP